MRTKTYAALALFVILLLFPAAGAALTRGPDAGGYTFYDSTEAGTESFSSVWEDISDTGTHIIKDEWRSGPLPIPIPLGFDFTFYGNTYSTVYVSNYGYLTFEDKQHPWLTIEPYLEVIPTEGGPKNFIAALLGYLYPGT
jgi:hypothetical protein